MTNTVQTGFLACCTIFYPFAACTGIRNTGLQVWDMVSGIKVGGDIKFHGEFQTIVASRLKHFELGGFKQIMSPVT